MYFRQFFNVRKKYFLSKRLPYAMNASKTTNCTREFKIKVPYGFIAGKF